MKQKLFGTWLQRPQKIAMYTKNEKNNTKCHNFQNPNQNEKPLFKAQTQDLLQNMEQPQNTRSNEEEEEVALHTHSACN